MGEMDYRKKIDKEKNKRNGNISAWKATAASFFIDRTKNRGKKLEGGDFLRSCMSLCV